MTLLHKDILEADVLVVGGGIGGLMAGMNASKHGASVIVAEKADVRRSGSGATGNDHFCCWIPEVHGPMEVAIKETLNSMHGKAQDIALIRTFFEQSHKTVKDWDDWGISMRPSGTWDFSGHAFPGRPRIFLKYAGANQKEVLVREAKKAGAKLVNHLSILDLIMEGGRVVGALALDVSKPKPVLKRIKAKTVILCTGTANRLYPSTNSPGWIFNTAFCPACTGSGRSLAYRNGARLVNMEMPNRHAGPKFFSRCGKATWIGVYRGPHGEALGPFVTKPTRESGDITADVWNSLFSDRMKNGQGPSYMDCTEIDQADLDYMMWGLVHEGNTGMLDYMKNEGIDVRKHYVEFTQYEPHLIGCRGIDIDEHGRTTVPGLYAAGDEVGNFRADLSGAAVFGWLAGADAAKAAKTLAHGSAKVFDGDTVQKRVAFCEQLMSRQNAPSWKDANLALQQIMRDYAGVEVRSETLLNAGLAYLAMLRKKAMETMCADNSHTLMRCHETLDLMDCGEVIMIAARERKETRERHIRSDFPFTNPLLAEKFLGVWKEKGKIRAEWRDIR